MSENAGGVAGTPVAIIGAGGIGLGFATVLADRGHPVTLVEPDTARRGGAAEAVRQRHAPMRQAGLAVGTADAAAARIAATESPGDAVWDAPLIIECGPERLDAKRALFAELIDGAGPDAVIATASSAITISQIVEQPAHRARCLVAHPVNPPTLIRVLEIVPAPETDPAVSAWTQAFFTAAGFAPVVLGAELPGFVFNRLQSAVLREAYRLVGEGVVDAPGIDRMVRDGLGLRWALSGPFETVALNTPGGVAAHAARMGPAYKAIGEARGERDCAWTPDLVAKVVGQLRAVLPDADIPARAGWRESALSRLIAARAEIIARAEIADDAD